MESFKQLAVIINVINLPRRDQRKLSLVEHLNEMGCLFRFWEGVESSSLGYKNVAEAHKNIVRDAKERDLPFVIIAEDDFRFSSPKSLDYYFSQMPEDFDLYFGMIYSGVIENSRIVRGFAGLQFYTIRKQFYDFFLSSPKNKHLDMFLGENCHKYLYYVCDPFVAYGESGYSDNFNRQWTFKEENLPRKLYRG